MIWGGGTRRIRRGTTRVPTPFFHDLMEHIGRNADAMTVDHVPTEVTRGAQPECTDDAGGRRAK